MTPTDSLRCDYISEINLQFELRGQLRDMEETGQTVGSEKMKRLIENSIVRAKKLDTQIQERLNPTI